MGFASFEFWYLIRHIVGSRTGWEPFPCHEKRASYSHSQKQIYDFHNFVLIFILKCGTIVGVVFHNRNWNIPFKIVPVFLVGKY